MKFRLIYFILLASSSVFSSFEIGGALLDGQISPEVVSLCEGFYEEYKEEFGIDSPPPHPSDISAYSEWAQKYLTIRSDRRSLIKSIPARLLRFFLTSNFPGDENYIVVIPGLRFRSMYRLSQKIPSNIRHVVFFGSDQRELIDVDFDGDAFVYEQKDKPNAPKTEFEAAQVVAQNFQENHPDAKVYVLRELEPLSFLGGMLAVGQHFKGFPENLMVYHIFPYGRDKMLTANALLKHKGINRKIPFYDAFKNTSLYLYYDRLAMIILLSSRHIKPVEKK